MLSNLFSEIRTKVLFINIQCHLDRRPYTRQSNFSLVKILIFAKENFGPNVLCLAFLKLGYRYTYSSKSCSLLSKILLEQIKYILYKSSIPPNVFDNPREKIWHQKSL